MIAFICGLLVGMCVAAVIVAIWLVPILDEAIQLTKELQLELKYKQ